MTTIRKINVSQVDGGQANDTDDDKLRPYGEIGIYAGDYDNSIDNPQLELLMFNGRRNNLKSKILSPGIFYGSNADSGDGAGLDTIKLIPDTALYQNDSDQYIIIDPTVPNHIHIRAGGTIDESSADLILGGEKNNLIVSDGGDRVSISTDGGEFVTNFWEFTNDGSTYLAKNPSSNVSYISSPINNTDIELSLGGGNGVSIVADVFSGSTQSWRFTNDGNLQFPDGGSLRVRSAPTTSIGSEGDKAGMIALDDDYIYYCTADYTGNTVIIPWSNVTNFPQTSQVQADILVPGLLEIGPLQITNCTVNGTSGITVPVDSYVNTSGNTYLFTITVEGFQTANQNSQLIATGVEAIDIWKRVAWNNDTW
jgi:hypothetical protein